MEDDTHSAQPTPQPPVPSTVTASALPAATADDARAQRLARRSQLRDEAERDAPEQERRRLESLAAKAAAREARRDAALAAQAAQWRSFGPARKLFADGIACVLGFLDLPSFVFAAQSCKNWREAAKHVHSLGAAELYDVAEFGLLAEVLSSPFHRLVQSVVDTTPCRRGCWGGGGIVCDRRLCDGGLSEWTRSSLIQLRGLEGLTSFSIRVDPNTLRAVKQPFKWPLHLRSVKLRLRFSYWQDPTPFDGAILLRGLLLCESLTRLEINMLDYDDVDLTILSEFKRLVHLRLGSCNHISAANLLAVKQLPLRTLGLVHNNEYFDFMWELDWIEPLLTPPHQLGNLQELELYPFEWHSQIDFSSLTSLTSLTPSLISVTVLPSIAALSTLRRLDLPFDVEFDMTIEFGPEFDDAFEGHLGVHAPGALRANVRAAFVMTHLTNMHALTSLYMHGVAFAESDLPTLRHLLPRLEQLTLHRVSMSSLRGLSGLQQLREFELFLNDGCNVSEADLIDEIGACKQLRQLKLTGVAALSPSVYEQLNPPSTLLPQLQTFSFSSPAIHL